MYTSYCTWNLEISIHVDRRRSPASEAGRHGAYMGRLRAACSPATIVLLLPLVEAATGWPRHGSVRCAADAPCLPKLLPTHSAALVAHVHEHVRVLSSRCCHSLKTDDSSQQVGHHHHLPPPSSDPVLITDGGYKVSFTRANHHQPIISSHFPPGTDGYSAFNFNLVPAYLKVIIHCVDCCPLRLCFHALFWRTDDWSASLWHAVAQRLRCPHRPVG